MGARPRGHAPINRIRGPMTCRRYRPALPHLPLVLHGGPRDVHSGALVEPDRGRVVAVHAEAGAALAGGPEPPQGLVQQRRADAATPPSGAHGERLDEPHPERLRRAQGDAADVLALAGHDPRIRIEPLLGRLGLAPLGLMRPAALERLLDA